jgi:hypothetical protein
VIPAIYICYRRVQEGKQPGVGQMLGYAYSLHDNTFETNWEIGNREVNDLTDLVETARR